MVELVEHHAITPDGAAEAMTGQGFGLHHTAPMAGNLDAELARIESTRQQGGAARPPR
jgi:hypothetical protein